MNFVSRNIDVVNVILILISGLLAYLFPLELFLFSFAILGPLHYLTEINWLNQKSYFTLKNNKVWLYLGILASIIIVAPKVILHFSQDHSGYIALFFILINNYSNAIIFTCLMLAIGLLFLKRKRNWLILVFISLLVALILNNIDSYSIFIGVLIPTVIHVYVFTLLFMLYGAKKSKSKMAYVSIILAILIPFIFIFIDINPSDYSFKDSLKSAYIDNNLHHTPVLFAKFLGLSDGKSFFFYEKLELKLLMFMSFIYLYHYLNWFSKTTTISWHKALSKKSSFLILILWVLMLSLFYFDFKIGFLIALFFSFLHVILEFPLNMISIKNILMKDN